MRVTGEAFDDEREPRERLVPALLREVELREPLVLLFERVLVPRDDEALFDAPRFEAPLFDAPLRELPLALREVLPVLPVPALRELDPRELDPRDEELFEDPLREPVLFDDELPLALRALVLRDDPLPLRDEEADRAPLPRDELPPDALRDEDERDDDDRVEEDRDEPPALRLLPLRDDDDPLFDAPPRELPPALRAEPRDVELLFRADPPRAALLPDDLPRDDFDDDAMLDLLVRKVAARWSKIRAQLRLLAVRHWPLVNCVANAQRAIGAPFPMANGQWLTDHGARPKAAPRSAFPGRFPVARPSSHTATPFTNTRRIPSESCCGRSKVARSVTVSGSKRTRSAYIPRFSTPRSSSPTRAAASAVILRIASSSVSTPSSRT